MYRVGAGYHRRCVEYQWDCGMFSATCSELLGVKLGVSQCLYKALKHLLFPLAFKESSTASV